MNVLLIESRPGAGDAARCELEAAGHRVHRCFDGGHDAAGDFACVGLAGTADCPLDERVDVALLVRGDATGATASEAGLRCAVRADVPVVAHDSAHLDPYEPWVKESAAGAGVVEACEDGSGDAALAEDLRATLAPLLTGAGLDAQDVRVALERRPDELVVHLVAAAELDAALSGAVGVRVLDVLRASPRERHARTSVQVHPPAP